MENSILEYIKQADCLQLNDMLLALMHRYKELNPHQEVYLFTLTGEDGETREAQLNQIVGMIRNHT